MGKGIRYTDEFKRDAVAQVKERGYSVKDVSDRLGVCTKSMYDWIRVYHQDDAEPDNEQAGEIRRLKSELRRVTEERDILKKATAYFAKETL
jgi:transposase